MVIEDSLDMGKSKKRVLESSSSDSSLSTTALRTKMADPATDKGGNTGARNLKKIRASGDNDTEVPVAPSKKQQEDIRNHTQEGSRLRVQELYDGNHRAPFHVFLRSVSNDKDNAKTSFLEISRKLYKSNIRYKECVPQSRNCWKISFDTRSEANSAISNRFLKEMGFEAFIPRSQLYRRGIVRDIPLDASMEEIIDCVNKDNGKIKVTSAFRLRRKDKSSGEWVDSHTVCMEFKGQEIPDSILIWRVRLFVAPYIPTVRMCFKCGRTGHISKFCASAERCLSCAGEHAATQDRCVEEKKCINCSGNHETRDRACPVLIKKKAIVRIMAIDNVTYAEADRMLTRNNLKGPIQREGFPLKTSRNFPRLSSDTPALSRDLDQRDVGDRQGTASSSYAEKASSPESSGVVRIDPKMLHSVSALLDKESVSVDIKKKVLALLLGVSNSINVPIHNG